MSQLIFVKVLFGRTLYNDEIIFRTAGIIPHLKRPFDARIARRYAIRGNHGNQTVRAGKLAIHPERRVADCRILPIMDCNPVPCLIAGLRDPMRLDAFSSDVTGWGTRLFS